MQILPFINPAQLKNPEWAVPVHYFVHKNPAHLDPFQAIPGPEANDHAMSDKITSNFLLWL
jgi:hypothetical protein